jgi:hypothetical protein
MKSKLVRHVEIALGDLGTSPWLPNLTSELVAIGWRDLYHNSKLLPSEYGTARVIARNPRAPRRVVTFLPIDAGNESAKYLIQIEAFSENFAHHYEEAGIKFYSVEEINLAKGVSQLQQAMNILKSVPTLLNTVALLVKSIHLIAAADDSHDVSFSEPHIPFSIFVSLPRNRGSISVLRIAEAIVHEAMHLQLTLVERIVPLVIQGSKKYFSPWKGEYRSLQGILHALYVFRVIDRFLEVLMLTRTVLKGSENYLYNRRNQISDEIKQVKLLQDCPYLTSCGSKFAQALLVS